MADRLLPCPFCGSSASIERIGDRRRSTIYQCDNCSCSLETGEEWGHGAGWNNRAGPLVPDGWALVPLDPTPEILAAFEIAYRRTEEERAAPIKKYRQEVYRALLEAASKPKDIGHE